MSAPEYSYIAKIVNIGESSVGKSSLTVRLCEGRFTASHDVTIGVEFGSRIVPVGPPASLALGINNPGNSLTAPTEPESTSKPVQTDRDALFSKGKKQKSLPDPPRTKDSQKYMKLSVWDTAGQETYRSITRSYFRGASGGILTFDLTRRSTFDSVTQWLHDFRQIAEEGVVVVLVGNKLDLASASLGEDGENKRAVTQEEAKEWARRNDVMCYVETSAKDGSNVERAFLEVAERIFQNAEAGKYDLTDRRSGVKGPGAGAGGNRGNKAGDSVVLNVSSVGNMNRDGKKGWGSCC